MRKKAGTVTALICLMAAVFTIYLTWMSGIQFADEQDVFYGGYNVVMSGDVYRYYPSQHMPLSYYLAAVGALLGARTVYQFRLFFYAAMTALWGAIWMRNREEQPKAGLFLLPAFYLFSLKHYSYANTMVSDHWQGIGLVMILCELIRFGREKRITGKTCVFVSLGLLLSFGSAFLSIYAVFAVMVGVTVVQIREWRARQEARKTIARESVRLVICCLAPFALLAGWYVVSGNWNNFVESAYGMNVGVYSQYARNYSNSVGQSLAGALPAWAENIDTAIRGFGQDPLLSLMIFTHVLCTGYAVIRLWKTNRIISVTYLAAVLLSGIRAYSGFHAAPYLACCSLSVSLCAGWLLEGWTAISPAWLKRGSRQAGKGNASAVVGSSSQRGGIVMRVGIGVLRVGLAGLIILGFAWPSLPAFASLRMVPGLLTWTPKPDGMQELLDISTDPGERVHTGDITLTSDQIMMLGLRLDEATPGSSNPWFYSVYGERELSALKENRTKVLLLYPEIPIWGYYLEDYAPDLMAYAEENYQKLTTGFYVRKDVLADVSGRLSAAGYGLTGTDWTAEGMIPWTWLEPGQADEQYLKAEGSRIMAVQLRTESVREENLAGITAFLLDAETGESLAKSELTHDQVAADGWTRFPFDIQVEPGKEYIVRFLIQEDAEMTMIRTYRTIDGTATEDVYARVRDMEMDYNLGMRVEYAVDGQCGILQEKAQGSTK